MPDCYVTKPNIQVIINEEALLHGLAQNLQALEYCSYPIFGNVLILFFVIKSSESKSIWRTSLQ